MQTFGLRRTAPTRNSSVEEDATATVGNDAATDDATTSTTSTTRDGTTAYYIYLFKPGCFPLVSHCRCQ